MEVCFDFVPFIIIRKSMNRGAGGRLSLLDDDDVHAFVSVTPPTTSTRLRSRTMHNDGPAAASHTSNVEHCNVRLAQDAGFVHHVTAVV